MADAAPTLSAFARTIQASLTSRTVHIRVIPAVVKFAERRAVLHALEKTIGPIELEHFKRLEETSSSYIAVCKTAAMATQLVNESPFKRIFISQDSTATATFESSAWGAAFRRTITDPIRVMKWEEEPVKDPVEGETKQGTAAEGGEVKSVNGHGEATATETHGKAAELGTNHNKYTINVHPVKLEHDHKYIVRMRAIHGPWPMPDGPGRETFISQALRHSVPAGALGPGLRDWETAHQLDEGSPGFDGVRGVQLADPRKESAQVLFQRERWRLKEYRDNVPLAMKGLEALVRMREPPAPPAKGSNPTPPAPPAPPSRQFKSKPPDGGSFEEIFAMTNESETKGQPDLTKEAKEGDPRVPPTSKPGL